MRTGAWSRVRIFWLCGEKSTAQTRCLWGKVRITNRDKHKRINSKGAEGKALHKPGVCEAKHARHENARVQNSKGNRGASTAQTRSLWGEVRITKRDTYAYKLNREPRAKALHKPDVCEAKYAKQYVTSKSVQILKRAEGKHYTNPAFERRSTQSYKQLLNQI